MRPTTSSDRQIITTGLLRKRGTFTPYFDVYDALATRGGDFVLDVGGKAEVSRQLSHQDILNTSKFLLENPEITFDHVKTKLQESLLDSLAEVDIRHAITLAVHATLMVDPAAQDRHGSGYVLSKYQPISWLPQESLLGFLKRSFPLCGEDARSADHISVALEEQASMKAWKLQKRLGVEFRGTNNIAEHLLYDSRGPSIYLFHHTSFLKAQLERFRNEANPLDMKIGDTFPQGTLPPQLLLEILHSLQSILFWWNDDRSMRILNRLIQVGRPGGFDKDCATWDGLVLFKETPAEFTYHYFGDRMAQLHDVLLKKPPRNRMERWFEWQSTEGNALFIALVALFITILTGLLSIAIAAVQTWISWQAWKYPATTTP